MAQILLGQSYYLRFDEKLWQTRQPYPPLGTLYAAACLREKGLSVALFDAMLAGSTDEWTSALDRHQPAFAVLFEDNFNYLSKMCLSKMRDAAFEMISAARQRGCTVIVHGSDATDHLKEYFEQGTDYILVGEAETALAELLLSLSGQSDRQPTEIPGVAGKENLQEPTAPRAPLRDLDLLPFPAWDLVDLDQYRRIWLKHHGFYSISMGTTRGCPYHCNWCAKPIYGQRYNSRSPENVVEEIQQIKEQVEPDHIWICDDIFGLKRGWIERFSQLVCERGLQIPFKCLQRTDLVNPKIARCLRDAGCESVWMGAESGSQRILDAMEKGATVQDTYRATRDLREVGIRVGYFLQFGYPGEEWEDILQTFRMVRDCMPDDIGISVSYPLPGTPFYQRVVSQLGPQKNWQDSRDMAMLFRGRFVPDFYRVLHQVLHKEYRARKSWLQLSRGDWRGLPALVRALSLPVDQLRLHRLRGRAVNPR